jgi:hypothetical protein
VLFLCAVPCLRLLSACHAPVCLAVWLVPHGTFNATAEHGCRRGACSVVSCMSIACWPVIFCFSWGLWCVLQVPSTLFYAFRLCPHCRLHCCQPSPWCSATC